MEEILKNFLMVRGEGRREREGGKEEEGEEVEGERGGR